MQPMRLSMPSSPEPSLAMRESSSSDYQAVSPASNSTGKGVWTEEEHARFLEALKMYPHGPWKSITLHVGTRSIRQVQTHAQKYMEKVERRARGLKTAHPRLVRRDHKIDAEVEQWWKRETGMLAGSPTRSKPTVRRRRRVQQEDSTNSARSSLTASPDTGEGKQEDEDIESDFELDYTSEGGEFEPLPLRSEEQLTPGSPLPTLEECLAVVNECLVEPLGSLHLDQSSIV